VCFRVRDADVVQSETAWFNGVDVAVQARGCGGVAGGMCGWVGVA